MRLAKSLAIALLLHAVAGADEPDAVVQTTLIAEVREAYVAGNGKPAFRFVPAGVVAQGDTVFYTLQIRNPTTMALRDVAVVQRVPANTTYVPGSASGPSAAVAFSVDGGQSFGSEKELKVSEGGEAARAAKAADFTHIRWQLRNALAPGSVALARFQAVFR
jgi:uncharacterized repeat protein (TIGR01451 family)